MIIYMSMFNAFATIFGTIGAIILFTLVLDAIHYRRGKNK